MKVYDKYAKDIDQKLFTTSLTIFLLLVLLPVLMFLAFDDPHDCFTCIGKDPDRKYSRF